MLFFLTLAAAWPAWLALVVLLIVDREDRPVRATTTGPVRSLRPTVPRPGDRGREGPGTALRPCCGDRRNPRDVLIPH